MVILLAGAYDATGSQPVRRLGAGADEVVGATCSEPLTIDALVQNWVVDVVATADPNPPADVEDGAAAWHHLESGRTP